MTHFSSLCKCYDFSSAFRQELIFILDYSVVIFKYFLLKIIIIYISSLKISNMTHTYIHTCKFTYPQMISLISKLLCGDPLLWSQPPFRDVVPIRIKLLIPLRL